ncbi:hypothetical protein PTKIN_Ptkin19aG0012900 [Pterospermum kingtungense]
MTLRQYPKLIMAAQDLGQLKMQCGHVSSIVLVVLCVLKCLSNAAENLGLFLLDSARLIVANVETDSSSILRSAEEEVDDDDDECLGLVPDSSGVTPQLPSPPTASGLYWSKDSHNQSSGAAFVPDICHSIVKNPFHSWRTGSGPKRRGKM